MIEALCSGRSRMPFCGPQAGRSGDEQTSVLGIGQGPLSSRTRVLAAACLIDNHPGQVVADPHRAPARSCICPSLSSMTRGRRCSSQTACSLEFKPPFVRPMRRGAAPFAQRRGSPLRLEVRGVDHELVWRPTLRRQPGEDAGEHARPAPAHEAVIQRLVQAAARRRIPPPISPLPITYTMPDSTRRSSTRARPRDNAK